MTTQAEKQYQAQADIIRSLCAQLLREGDAEHAKETLMERLGEYIIKIEVTGSSGEVFASAADNALLNRVERAGGTAETDTFPLDEGGAIVITRFTSFAGSDDVLLFDGSLWMGIVIAAAAAAAVLASLAAVFAKPLSGWLTDRK